MSRLALVLALVACSGTKARSVDDARGTPQAESPPPRDAALEKTDPAGTGDVQVRVEWKNVPAVARAAPGRNACGMARLPSVAPNVLWGIPEVFVAIEPQPSTPRAGAGPSRSISGVTKRIVLGDCALSPRAAAAGTIVVASATEAPATLTLVKAGSLPLGSSLKDEKPRTIQLPIAGHEVEIVLEPSSIYRLSGDDGEEAWIVSAGVGITEASGNAQLRDVPAGTHEVTAWLPPRSGQPARTARGKVTVPAGQHADVTLDITSP